MNTRPFTECTTPVCSKTDNHTETVTRCRGTARTEVFVNKYDFNKGKTTVCSYI